jgi:hypothetical protein
VARVTRGANAAPAVLPAVLRVAAPSHALAAIVAAEGGSAVAVALDRTLGPTEIRVGAALHGVGGGLAARDVLDDPRNAPRLGAGVRKVLAAARPDLAAELERNHRAFSHTFVRKVLAWNARLAGSPYRGKRIINSVDRAALFAWAGVVVDPRGQQPPPALTRLPRDAAEPTLASYAAYVDSLVASLT